MTHNRLDFAGVIPVDADNFAELLAIQSEVIAGLTESYTHDQLAKWVKYIQREKPDRYGKYSNLAYWKEGRIQGFVSWSIDGDDAAIECLYVREPYRHQGVGRLLLQGAEKYLYGRAIHVRSTLNAKSFYERNGYVFQNEDTSRAGFLIASLQKRLPGMMVFISGSINSGKTTTSKALARKLGADWINVDDLNDSIPNFNLATDLDKSMDLAIQAINEGLDKGRSVVANYVVRQRDFDRFASEIHTDRQHVITLAPRMAVAQGRRGDRTLSDWEVQRIKYHYDTGIASPKFGQVIDNSDMTVNQTVDRMVDIINAGRQER